MFTCENCQALVKSIVIHDKALWCWGCHNNSKGVSGVAPAVIDDSIPGGILMKHGVCNDDGTPRRFYSKSEIRQAAYDKGYFQGTDTPRTNPRIQEERAQQAEARRRG